MMYDMMLNMISFSSMLMHKSTLNQIRSDNQSTILKKYISTTCEKYFVTQYVEFTFLCEKSLVYISQICGFCQAWDFRCTFKLTL